MDSSGNSDVYGLGIRLGYYAQLFAMWIQSSFTTVGGNTVRSVHTLFMLAMLAGLAVISIGQGSSSGAEACLLVQIVSVSYFITPTQISQTLGRT